MLASSMCSCRTRLRIGASIWWLSKADSSEPSDSGSGIAWIWIKIGPTANRSPPGNNAILNGIEIWKLNNSAGRLDGLWFRVGPVFHRQRGPTNRMVSRRIMLLGGIISAGILMLCVFCCLARKKKKRDEEAEERKKGREEC